MELRLSTKLALVVLAVMAALMLGSVWNDSATMDELAHIPAGFGYVKKLDYRLNPEHPPLIKVLATLSADLLVRPYFPTDTKAWRQDINGQWDQGRIFLYESGNDADRILFFARLPVILISLALGWLLFLWVRKRFDEKTALLSLTLFAFSPTILAHSRYVTTDLGAAFGFFIGIAAFLVFLENPSWKNTILAGIAFAAANLLKFSLVLLVPMYALMLIGWVISRPHLFSKERLSLFWELFKKTIAIGVVGIVLIGIVYAPFVWNYPQERQLRDADFILKSYPSRLLVNLNLALIRNDYTRGLGEYVLGFLMVSQRASGGNTAYFLGEVSNQGSRLYFPLLYLLKEPLALHILTLLAIGFGIKKAFGRTGLSPDLRGLSPVRGWIHEHFVEFSALVMIAVYWAASLASPLNIGVRHVLPTFPFIYLLVARGISEWIHHHTFAYPFTFRNLLTNLYQIFVARAARALFVGILILWLVASTAFSYPHFLSYYNVLGGGTKNGWKIATDSNYDWGQDLKRLQDWIDKNLPAGRQVAVDYFGGGNPAYYLGDPVGERAPYGAGKFEPWYSSKGPAHGWLAISASFRQSAFGRPAAGFQKKPEDSYEWLRQYEPVARAGTSIFIYKLP